MYPLLLVNIITPPYQCTPSIWCMKTSSIYDLSFSKLKYAHLLGGIRHWICNHQLPLKAIPQVKKFETQKITKPVNTNVCYVALYLS